MGGVSKSGVGGLQRSKISSAKKGGWGDKTRNEAMATPQALVFECFECGIPCSVDPKIGVQALPKNLVLLKSVAQAKATGSAGGATTLGEGNSGTEAGSD